MHSLVTERCRFSTDRLVADDWHRLADRFELDLVDVVTRLLTASTTSWLPSDWHGEFGRARASAWITTRDAESPTLLVVERASGEPVGLLILFETAEGDDLETLDVRLGYVVGEAFWGRGLGSELVSGLVRWAEAEPTIKSISGGVGHENTASARVLVKNGFLPTAEAGREQIYRLALR